VIAQPRYIRAAASPPAADGEAPAVKDENSAESEAIPPIEDIRRIEKIRRAEAIRCELCPHRCLIASGKSGLCRVRVNVGGAAAIPYYARVSALNIDPIEKKPLYHFKPGSSILSVGFVGCNLRCPFCQNWEISQSTDAATRELSPAALVAAAQAARSFGIAYTYSEPLIHLEYVVEAMERAHEAGLANVLVTNGCILEPPAREILALADAANVDLKAYSAETYERILGGDLESVTRFITIAAELGVHVEVTTLVVPGLNDAEQETDACADFLASISVDLPWHLSAYRPEYKWKAPPTPSETLRRIATRARNKLRYVYVGNVAFESNDTVCPHCAAVAVRRRAYKVDASGLRYEDGPQGKICLCAGCGEPLPFK
jgi:pyruvate formate lyase activating enzyme